MKKILFVFFCSSAHLLALTDSFTKDFGYYAAIANLLYACGDENNYISYETITLEVFNIMEMEPLKKHSDIIKEAIKECVFIKESKSSIHMDEFMQDTYAQIFNNILLEDDNLSFYKVSNINIGDGGSNLSGAFCLQLGNNILLMQGQVMD